MNQLIKCSWNGLQQLTTQYFYLPKVLPALLISLCGFNSFLNYPSHLIKILSSIRILVATLRNNSRMHELTLNEVGRGWGMDTQNLQDMNKFRYAMD